MYIEWCITYDQEGYCYECDNALIPLDGECMSECSFNIMHCEVCDPNDANKCNVCAENYVL